MRHAIGPRSGVLPVSVPIAGIALALLAIPLAYVNPRLKRSINLIIAILLLMISLNVMNIIQAQIDQQRIWADRSPCWSFICRWQPSLPARLLSVPGAVFIWRSRTQATTTDHGSAGENAEPLPARKSPHRCWYWRRC